MTVTGLSPASRRLIAYALRYLSANFDDDALDDLDRLGPNASDGTKSSERQLEEDLETLAKLFDPTQEKP